MDKLQYDSFYKFLVSLGMLLITLPVLAYLYILNTNYKLISQNDYDNLIRNFNSKDELII
ncbi:hypothetical protein DWZ60_16195 [Blautia sp. AF34-10]|nr:hypothetical protein DWZ60_16195 [Blautia sp. AF34-10]